jgi:hypothetical protein
MSVLAIMAELTKNGWDAQIRTVANVCHQKNEVYRAGEDEFLHEAYLPASLPRAVAKCVAEIRGATGFVHVPYLMEKLGINKAISRQMLKSALIRHPGIIGVQRTGVAWKDTFEGKGLMKDQMVDILRAAGEPLTLREIKKRFPPGIDFALVSMSQLSRRSPWIKRVVGNKYELVESEV